MKYVLIFFMAFSRSGGPATAEFGDRQACEYAREIVTKGERSNWPGASLAVCVPYSTEAK